MKLLKSILCFAIVMVCMPCAHAGVYTNELSKCLVESTSVRDRTALVNWMFSAASFHPAVKPIASVSEKQLDEINKSTANLFMRLLTEACRQETINALKYEGEVAIPLSFKVLGEVAARELFSSPEVDEAFSGFVKYLDEDKLKSLVESR